MLSTKPKITYTPANSNVYKPSVLVLIDSDKGPSDLTLVDSLTSFYELYLSERRSPSYRLAERLITMNYRVYLKRVKLCNSRTSLRLLSTNSPQYVYPRYDEEYSRFYSSSNPIETGTYTYKLVINRLPVTGDYIFIGDKTGWDLIWFDSTTPPIPWNICRRLIRVNLLEYKSLNDVAKQLKSELQSKLGYIVTISEDTNAVELLITAPWKIFQPVTTFSDSYIDEFANYDIECSLTENDKVIDFYSQLDNGTNDITIDISKWLDKYRIEVSERNFVNDYDLIKEIYTIDPSLGTNEFESISSLSKLVTVKCYNTDIPLGKFELGRIRSIEATADDYVNALNELILDNITIDFISDSAFYQLNPSDEQLQLYYSALSKLQTDTQGPTIMLLTYNTRKMTEYLNQHLLTLFNSTVEYNDELYPSYVLFLDLLSYNTVEGYLNGYLVNETYSLPNTDALKVNTLIVDSYNIVEIRNPLAYLFENKLIALNMLIEFTLTLNNFIDSLDTLSEITEISVMNLFNSVKGKISKVINTSLELDISNLNISDRYMKVVFTMGAEFSTNSEYELFIPIQGIL